MTDLAKYVVSLEAETAKYQRNLEKANKRLDKFNRDQSKILDSIKGAFKGLATAAVAGLGGLAAASISTAKGLDRIAKAAKDANVGVETFQAWEFAATQSGVSVEQFSAALGRANRRVGLFATDGTGPAAKSLERLGIAVKDANGNVRSQEAIIRDYVKSLEGLSSQAEKTAEITALFGDDARRMALVFGQGTKELEAFEQKARDLGLVIGGDTLRAAEQFNDQMDILSRVLRAGLAQNLNAISDVILNIGNAVIRALPHIQNFFDYLTRTKRFEITDRLTEVKNEIALVEQRIQQSQGFTQGLFGERAKQDVENFKQELIALRAEQQKLFSELSNMDRRPGGNQQGQLLTPQVSPVVVLTDKQKESVREYNEMLLEGLNNLPNRAQQISDSVMAIQDTIASSAEKQREMNEKARESFDNLFTQNLVQAADSGFDSVLKSWAKTLQQMVAKLISSKIFDYLAAIGGGGTGSFGAAFASFFGGARADGGPVSSGKSYIVGERGPELFTPRSSGNIIPNGSTGGLVINVDAPNSDVGMIPKIEAAVERAVAISTQKRIEAERRSQ